MSNYELIRLKDLSHHLQLNCAIDYFLKLYLILHTCIQKFDLTENLENELNMTFVRICGRARQAPRSGRQPAGVGTPTPHLAVNFLNFFRATSVGGLQ